nr:GIY-YIG nuclease family protein [uncultured Cohaesibacter sp.]
MTDHKDRFSELKKIPKIAQLDHRLLLDENGRPAWEKKLTRNERRKLNSEGKKIGQQYNRVLRSLSDSGVGFPVDQTVRHMAVEYTNRYASSGTQNQPISFNYFEPFYDIKLMKGTVAPYINLVPETNHLFSAADFFDFLTSSDSDGFEVRNLQGLPEARTFHFTSNGVIEDLTFFDASGREYIFSGFSMVRRGNSIHWFLVAGEMLTSDEWELRTKDVYEIDLSDIPPWKRAFLKDCIERSGSTTGAPMKLEGTDTAIRTLVAGEFDISTEKHVGKSIFIETENSFTVFSDDPEVLFAIAPQDKQQIIDNSMNRIGEADVLWNMAEGFFQLPQYFETRVTVSINLAQGQGKKQGLTGKGGRGIKAKYVAVEAVAIEDVETPSAIRRVSMPMYSTETGGHWRRLKFGQTGRDRDGNPVPGKTWVNRSSPWRADSPRDHVVYVKDCLALAKTRIEELYAKSAAQDALSEVSSEAQGVLYVLRCTLMQEEIYKVGWTAGTATERAQQLSSATGVPLAFVVVESWVHKNPEALETEVHAQLSPYRTNNQREFFRLNFEDIRRIIVNTIERVHSTSSKT